MIIRMKLIHGNKPKRNHKIVAKMARFMNLFSKYDADKQYRHDNTKGIKVDYKQSLSSKWWFIY